MTHPLYNRNNGCVAFKGLRIFDVCCVLPYPTLIRVRIEVLFCSKMFEGCYDRSLNWKWQRRTCWRSRCCMYFCRTRLWTYIQMMTVSDLTHCPMRRCDDGVFTRQIKHFLFDACNNWWSLVILWCLYLQLSRCWDDSLLKLELVFWTFEPTIFELSRQINDENEPRTANWSVQVLYLRLVLVDLQIVHVLLRGEW